MTSISHINVQNRFKCAQNMWPNTNLWTEGTSTTSPTREFHLIRWNFLFCSIDPENKFLFILSNSEQIWVGNCSSNQFYFIILFFNESAKILLTLKSQDTRHKPRHVSTKGTWTWWQSHRSANTQSKTNPALRTVRTNTSQSNCKYKKTLKPTRADNWFAVDLQSQQLQLIECKIKCCSQ